jgi:hypothetical protein
LVDEEIAKEDIKPITFVLVLRKIWINVYKMFQCGCGSILVGSNGMYIFKFYMHLLYVYLFQGFK